MFTSYIISPAVTASSPHPSYRAVSSRAARCAANFATEEPGFACPEGAAVRLPNTLL